MPASYIEHRPHSSSEHTPISHYVILVNGEEIHGKFSTQHAAKTVACHKGYHPVHVARQRHLQDKAQPAHWKKDVC